MTVKFHLHNAPGCGTAHSTTCSAVMASGDSTSCDMIEAGVNKGRYACRHVPPGGLTPQEREFTGFVDAILGRAPEQGARRAEPMAAKPRA